MHNLETAYKLYNQMMNENPDYANKLVKQWSKLMPNEFAKVIYCDRYGKHIVNKEQYELGLSFIEGQNGKAPEISGLCRGLPGQWEGNFPSLHHPILPL